MVTNENKVMMIETNKNPGFNVVGLYDSFWKGLLDLTLYSNSKTKDYVNLF